MSIDKATIEKLKKILKVSDSIKMEQMRRMLKLDQEAFDEKLLDWEGEFGFRIDRDYVNINVKTVDDFINQLEN